MAHNLIGTVIVQMVADKEAVINVEKSCNGVICTH